MKRGFYTAAEFLRNISDHATTFASLAIMGIKIPSDNNRLERLMGEVSKRCKHKWMSWTDKGSEALLALLVCRLAEPGTYQDFFHRNLYGPSAHYPDLG